MMNIIELPLSEIKPYPNNPRKNKKGVAAVKRSIEEFGFTQPLIVNAERVILCGHTRYEAAKELNLEFVPVIVKTDLTPQQERAYRVADTKSQKIESRSRSLCGRTKTCPHYGIGQR